MRAELFVVMRIVLGLYLIWVGSKELNEVDNLKRFIPNTCEMFEKNFLEPGKYNYDLTSIKKNAKEILLYDYALIIFSGVLIIFNLRMAKLFFFAALLIDFIFVHNIVYYRDEKFLINASRMIAILGGTFYF